MRNTQNFHTEELHPYRRGVYSESTKDGTIIGSAIEITLQRLVARERVAGAIADLTSQLIHPKSVDQKVALYLRQKEEELSEWILGTYGRDGIIMNKNALSRILVRKALNDLMINDEDEDIFGQLRDGPDETISTNDPSSVRKCVYDLGSTILDQNNLLDAIDSGARYLDPAPNYSDKTLGDRFIDIDPDKELAGEFCKAFAQKLSEIPRLSQEERTELIKLASELSNYISVPKKDALIKTGASLSEIMERKKAFNFAFWMNSGMGAIMIFLLGGLKPELKAMVMYAFMMLGLTFYPASNNAWFRYLKGRSLKKISGEGQNLLPSFSLDQPEMDKIVEIAGVILKVRMNIDEILAKDFPELPKREYELAKKEMLEQCFVKFREIFAAHKLSMSGLG